MKKTTIYIEDQPFTYDDEIDDITYETIFAISTEDAKELLQTTKRLFDQCGIRFSLAFGTLLGAVRDKAIIKGDEDVDIFVENEAEFRKHIPFLHAHGLKLCRIYEGYVYSFRTNERSFIDVYFKEKFPTSIWSLWCYSLLGKAVPKRCLSGYDKIEFLGDDYLCPHKPERILKFWYGNDWRTPVKGHKFTYDTPSHYWWVNGGKIKCERYIAYMKKPIKFLIGWKYWRKYFKS